MRLLEIKLIDFRPYRGETTVNLRGIHSAVILGPNGAGKSSLIIDSLLFGFFGKARKQLDKLINDQSSSMSVSITFEHQGHEYIINRVLEREKSQKLFIIKDNEDITERDGLVTPNEKILNNILGVSYELLLSTSIAQQSDINRLSNMNPGEREEIISEMLNLQYWRDKKDNVSKILTTYKDIEKTIASKELQLKTTQDTLNTNKFQITAFNEALIPLRTKQNLFANKYEELKLQKIEYDKIKVIEAEFITKRSTLITLIQSHGNLPQINEDVFKKEIESYKDQIIVNDNLIAEIEVARQELKEKIGKTSSLRNDIQYFIKDEEQTRILDQVPCIGMDIHNTCQLLQSALKTQQEIIQIKERGNITDLKAKNLELLEEFKNLDKQADRLDKAKADLQTDTNNYKLKINIKNEQLKQISQRANLEEKIQYFTKEVKELEDKQKVIPYFDPSEFLLYESELTKVGKNIQEKEQTIAFLQGQADTLESQINLLQKELDKHTELNIKLANYRILHQAYSDIPALIFERAIPIVEGYTNEILEKIFPEDRISLRSFRETKKNTLQKSLDVVGSVGTGVRDFEDLAGSEAGRQSLALRLALARYNGEINHFKAGFMFIDEGGFGNLDTEQRYKMKIMLQDISTNFDLFLVITHIDEFKDMFGRQIIVNPNGKGDKILII